MLGGGGGMAGMVRRQEEAAVCQTVELARCHRSMQTRADAQVQEAPLGWVPQLTSDGDVMCVLGVGARCILIMNNDEN